MDKNCGECKHFDTKGSMCLLIDCNHEFAPDKKSCLDFEPLHPTNGDVIRAIADNKKFAYYICEVSTKHKLFTADDLAEWLNAPAESEVEDK